MAGGWREHLRTRFAGQPLKTVALRFTDASRRVHARKGELMLSDTGIESSLVYALSALLREMIAAKGAVTVELDLLPDRSAERVLAEVSHPRGSRSLASHLQSRAGLKGAKVVLLRELLKAEQWNDLAQLAGAIKSLLITLAAPRPIEESISSAGGCFEALDKHFMLRALPGVFVAGEMLDWEAPTGGYLLTACLASGRVAGQGALEYLHTHHAATD